MLGVLGGWCCGLNKGDLGGRAMGGNSCVMLQILGKGSPYVGGSRQMVLWFEQR
jgi:hypothetical protein